MSFMLHRSDVLYMYNLMHIYMQAYFILQEDEHMLLHVECAILCCSIAVSFTLFCQTNIFFITSC